MALHCHCGPVKSSGHAAGVAMKALRFGLCSKALCALASAASAAQRAWLLRAWLWLASWSTKTLRALKYAVMLAKITRPKATSKVMAPC
jgi:hypothetical protein